MPSRARAPTHVLFVEDHDDTREIIRRLLHKHDYVVDAASTAMAAVELASAVRCDVALLDIGLPDGYGIDLLKRLRLLAPISAIACTAHVMRHEIASYLAAGFDEVVMKPFQPDDLLAALRRVLLLPPVVMHT